MMTTTSNVKSCESLFLSVENWGFSFAISSLYGAMSLALMLGFT